MTRQTYIRKVNALIPEAVTIANRSTAVIKAKGREDRDDIWDREYHLAMDELKYKHKLIGWKR